MHHPKSVAVEQVEAAEGIEARVEAEYGRAAYIPLRQALTPYRVAPSVRMLRWPYEAEPKDYPCWVIADLGPDRPFLLAYSRFGHGTRGDCWGILAAGERWYGRDDSWFLRLEDAFVGAGAWHGTLPQGYEVR